MTESNENAVHETVATIDNGKYGTHTIRFETGRLARQAAGSVVAYLDDDTMLLSATTAGKSPKEQFDFFPLTVDVEERMYAAGRIPGSFFRREGRPGEEAILTCRLIDRPLRPSFVKGLRNEVQVVVTIMALESRAPLRRRGHQRRVGVHAAVRPAVQRPDRRHPGRAHRGPVGRVPEPRTTRAGDVRHGRRRPGARLRRRRDHDGRGRGHRGRRSSSSPTAPPGRPRRSSPRASRRPSRSSPSCAARRPSSPRWPPSRPSSSRSSRTTRDEVLDAVTAEVSRAAGGRR